MGEYDRNFEAVAASLAKLTAQMDTQKHVIGLLVAEFAMNSADPSGKVNDFFGTMDEVFNVVIRKTPVDSPSRQEMLKHSVAELDAIADLCRIYLAELRARRGSTPQPDPSP